MSCWIPLKYFISRSSILYNVYVRYKNWYICRRCLEYLMVDKSNLSLNCFTHGTEEELTPWKNRQRHLCNFHVRVVTVLVIIKLTKLSVLVWFQCGYGKLKFLDISPCFAIFKKDVHSLGPSEKVIKSYRNTNKNKYTVIPTDVLNMWPLIFTNVLYITHFMSLHSANGGIQ